MKDGWKRAGCVLLAAQMTMSVLPVDSMAAYVDNMGRSGAILASAAETGQSPKLFRQTLPKLRTRMPLLSQSVAELYPKTETALTTTNQAGLPLPESLAPDTGPGGRLLTTETEQAQAGPTEDETNVPLPGEGTDAGGEKETPPPAETPPASLPEEEAPAPPTQGTDVTDPEDQEGTAPEGETSPTTPPGEETPPPETPVPPEEGTDVPDPEGEGETTPGDETTPVTPPEDSVTPPESPEEGTEGSDPEGKDETTDIPPEDTPLPDLDQAPIPGALEVPASPLETNVVPEDSGDEPKYDNAKVYLNFYGYNHWSTLGTERFENDAFIGYTPDSILGSGAEKSIYHNRYPAYNPEIEPDSGDTELKQWLDAEGYDAERAPAFDDMMMANYPEFADAVALFAYPYIVEAGDGPQLDRIPDMKFEGWVYSSFYPQEDTSADGESQYRTNMWYHGDGSEEEPFSLGLSDSSPVYDEDDPTILRYYTQTSETRDRVLKALWERTEEPRSEWDPSAPNLHVNVVAKWVPSHRVDLTALKLTGLPVEGGTEREQELLYYDAMEDRPTSGSASALTPEEYGDDGGDLKGTYYVQAPAGIDSLALDFTTYEPGAMIKIESSTLSQPILYRYEREEYEWDVESAPYFIPTPADYQALNRDEDSLLERTQTGHREYVPDPVNGNSEYGVAPPSGGDATNSFQDPARGVWKLPKDQAIPLKIATSDKDYTKITITVVAPDGTMDEKGNTTGTTGTYTFYVRRAADPEMTLENGNTPYSMIAAVQDQTKREAAQAYFDSNLRFDPDTITTTFPDYNKGGVYLGQYSAEAWTEVNYDRDPTALVVYQDATFTVPDLTLFDGQGEEVKDKGKITYSLRLRRAPELSLDRVSAEEGQEVYYDRATGELSTELVDNPADQREIDLRGLNVLPGIYSIKYKYVDSKSGVTYTSDDSVYMDKQKAKPFSRPLIVLPRPGDLNMDGMVTSADAILLEKALTDPDSFLFVDKDPATLDQVERLFKYRVCDVDGDGQVNTSDVDTLKSGYVSLVVSEWHSDYFYFNSGDNGDPGQKPLTTETAGSDASKAELSVEYLGRNLPEGVIPDGVDKDHLGGVQLYDTIWYGVKLDKANNLPTTGNTGVQAFEFTLLYDSDVLSAGYLKDLTTWDATIERANLSADSTTPWKDAYALETKSDGTLTGGPGGSLQQQKPGCPDLSDTQLATPALEAGRVSTYTFTLRLKPGAAAQSLKNGYLLYVPFYVRSHPSATSSSVALVEPLMSGRNFSLVYSDGTVSAWNPQGRRDGRGDSDYLFGDKTFDLGKKLAYIGSAKIPVGEDKTERVTLYNDLVETDYTNAMYGVPYSIQTNSENTSDGKSLDINGVAGDKAEGELPPGLTYEPTVSNGTISGTPTQAGTYHFVIRGRRYTIVVDKAPLTLSLNRVDDRYYGEENSTVGTYHFHYDPSQLKSFELTALAGLNLKNDGNGLQLEKILDGYKAPTITPVDSQGAVLVPRTPAGTYTAKLTGGEATNYVFQYLRKGETAVNNVEATGDFTVYPRPIDITGIIGSVGTIWHRPKDNMPYLAIDAFYQADPKDEREKTFTASIDPTYYGVDRLHGAPILAEDVNEIYLSCEGEFLWNQYDKDHGSGLGFALEKPREERDVRIKYEDMELKGSRGANYRIAHYGGASTLETTGTVQKTPLKEVEISFTDPLQTVYNYGAQYASPDGTGAGSLTTTGLYSYKLTWETGEVEGPWEFNWNQNTSGNRSGLRLCWLDHPEDTPDPTKIAYANQNLTVKDHNGRYLCFYVDNGNGTFTKYVYHTPITVRPANLTLTVGAQDRYYGEANQTAVIRYDPKELGMDDTGLGLRGDVTELLRLDGFVSPTVSYEKTAVVDSDPTNDVNAKTNVGDYYVLISGGQASNYKITYAQAGMPVVSDSFGYAPLTVKKRPIRVTEITGNVGFLYDDTTTKVLPVRGTWPQAATAGQEFELQVKTPTERWASSSEGGSEKIVGLTGKPVLDGDLLSFTYNATFVTDKTQKPFFDLKDWAPGSDTKDHPVTIADLRLDPKVGSGGNYELVFEKYANDLYGYPETTTDGKGKVVIRQIESLEVRKGPVDTEYTYGDKLHLDNFDESFQGFQVRIHYKAASGYASYEDVTYQVTQVGDVVSNTFADYGLWLEWSDENGQPVENGKRVGERELTTVGDHNGRYIVVKGQRKDTHPVITAPVTADTQIQVKKRTIHITAAPITRNYGSGNLASQWEHYEGTIDWKADLIPEDWEKLEKAGFWMETTYNIADPDQPYLYLYSNSLGTGAESAALQALDPGYRGPEFRTPANEKSPAGSYPLEISLGSMANYDFAYAPGVITVTKRKIKLVSISRGEPQLDGTQENPLVTMLLGSKVRDFHGIELVFDPARTDNDVTVWPATGTEAAVLEGDRITLTMTVEFGFKPDGTKIAPELLTIPNGDTTTPAWVRIKNVKVATGGENYELINDELSGVHQLGRIDSRKIVSMVLADPTAVKTSYAYGDALDLSGVNVLITFEQAPGEFQAQQEVASVTSRQGLQIHYLEDPALVRDPNLWEGVAQRPLANAGEHLTIAPDENGFYQDGKYLAITMDPDLNFGQKLQPVVAEPPIHVEPQELEYTLTAQDKDYDGTTQAWGTISVDKNQIYPGDVVYIHTGKDYTHMDMETDGVNYLFPTSETYGVGASFAFTDPNVAYVEAPTYDHYGEVADMGVELRDVSLMGRDARNYRILQAVPADDPKAPRATIHKAARPAPDVAALTTMSTDIHTNVMRVSVDSLAADYGDPLDAYNGELHFEYQLQYLADEADPGAGLVTVTEADPDGWIFGGEPVSEIGENFEPAATETNKLTPGIGQPIPEWDQGFGTREPLPRDTYFRAQVRLAETHNYKASAYTPSISDADMALAVAGARAAEEGEITEAEQDPEKIQPPRPIPEGQRLGKTYQYRFDVIASQTMQGADGQEHAATQLDSVWFADRATYPSKEYLDALTTNVSNPRYQGYYWDARQSQGLEYPLDLREPILVSVTEGGAPVLVNADGTVRLYASLEQKRNPTPSTRYTVEILSSDLEVHMGDDPIQLEALALPNSRPGLRWVSSDPSVATVKKGLVTFVGEGTATIWVYCSGASDSIEVTVLPLELPLPLPPTDPLDLNYLGAYMTLSGDMRFYPENRITRAELAMSLANLIHPDYQPEQAQEISYVDITGDMPCAQAVQRLSQIGVLRGVGEGRFAPDQYTTRAEMAAILVRLKKLPPAPVGQRSFLDDGPEDTWATAEIEALVQAGITQGTGDGYYSPGRNLTRAEVAVFLTRLLEFRIDPEREGLIYPIDVPGTHWAWREILQAVNGVGQVEEVEESVPAEK